MSASHVKTHDHSQCMDCFSKLSEYIDSELGSAVCKDIEKHLENCACCSSCLKSLRKTIELCRSMDEKPVPEEMTRRLKDMMEFLFLND